MTSLTYEIVEHDGGWAYRVGETFSEAFATHEAARRAAERAAAVQGVPGQTTVIHYEDPQGHWHTESDPGEDRPETHVKG